MSKSATEKFRLIFHIGAGKTGTSSIQRSLRDSRDVLSSCGYDYWGLMLEFAPVKKYPWQNASEYNHLLKLRPNEAKEQIIDVLQQSIEISAQRGVSTAIWSNELFFSRSSLIAPALKELEAAGLETHIVAYVRRHDKWAQSAFLQWGIKHKNYEGKISSYKQYISRHPVRFYPAVRGWRSLFPKSFYIRNFDAVDDVVNDFKELVGLPEQIQGVRVYESPDAEELILRAIFNNTIPGPALPELFDDFFNYENIDPRLSVDKWLSELLPSAQDLSDTIQDAISDIESINKELSSSDQPMLDVTPSRAKEHSVNLGIVVSILYQMLIREKFKTNNLRKRLDKVQAEVTELRTKLGV